MLAWSSGLAVSVYVLLWIGFIARWDWLVSVDAATLAPFHRYGTAHPGWVTAWDVFCAVLGPAAFRLATLVIIVVAFVRRRIRLAMFLVFSVEFSGLLTEVAKEVANRPRPSTALVFAPGMAFPSGHALGVMVAVLALLTVALPHVRKPLRGWLVALGVVVIVAIGLARVVLNVHHLSDVVAGWALGYAYFAICLLFAPPSPVAGGTPEARGSAR